MPLVIAGLQTAGTLRDIDANLRELESAAEEAAANGAVDPEVVASQQKANPYLADRRGTLYPTLIEEQERP